MKRLLSLILFIVGFSTVGCSIENNIPLDIQGLNNNMVSSTIIVPLIHDISKANKPLTTNEFAGKFSNNEKYNKISAIFRGLTGSKVIESPNHYIMYVQASKKDIENIGKTYKLDWIIENTFYSWDSKSYPQKYLDTETFSRQNIDPKAISFKGYTIDQIRNIYNIPDNLSGSKQSVAIITSGKPNENDLNMFGKDNNIGYTPLSLIDTQQDTNMGVSEESTIDYESIRATAPNAKIEMYSSGSDNIADFTEVLNRGISNTMAKIVSISWGLPESELPDPIMNVWHTIFEEASVQGINIVAATGDRGQTDGTSTVTVEYPASDPLVIAVGGVTKKLNQPFRGWDNSGAGFIHKWNDTESKLQNSSDINRHIPDLVMVSDPQWGIKGYINNNVKKIGGTSIAAPMFAGILADIQESIATTVPNIRNVLYRINSDSFNDVTVGASSNYNAQIGFDVATGLGVPNVRNMISNIKKEIK